MMSRDDLKPTIDNGQMRMWASQGYANMVDDFYDGEITYNVNLRWLREINRIRPGNLVMTTEDETALVLELVSRDMQGFDIYKVLIQGKEFLYSTLELVIIGD